MYNYTLLTDQTKAEGYLRKKEDKLFTQQRLRQHRKRSQSYPTVSSVARRAGAENKLSRYGEKERLKMGNWSSTLMCVLVCL